MPSTILDILHEDENLIAVNKPANVLVVPDRWDRSLPTIQDMLREYLRRKGGVEHPNIRVIHRLDKDTSGVLVLAKNIHAQTFLSKQFEAGDVSKTYHAVVRGVPSPAEGIINEPLKESAHKPGTMVASKKGKHSVTLYKVLETFAHFALVEAKPLTGRTHQVRVHLRTIGHPLAIDPVYGSSEPIFLSELKKDYRQKGPEEKPILTRTPLHASRLSFTEPAEKKTLVLEAPLAKDIERFLRDLRKYG